MKINKKVFEKGKITKEIDKVNKIMDEVKEYNATIDQVNETLILVNNEVIDKKNFSIMTLPSTKDVFRNL